MRGPLTYLYCCSYEGENVHDPNPIDVAAQASGEPTFREVGVGPWSQTHPGEPRPDAAQCLRPEEEHKPQHTQQIAHLIQPPGSQEAEQPHGSGEETEILHPYRDDEEQQHLHLGVEHGESQQQRQRQTVGVGRDAGGETAQHGADHPQQEVEVEAEIAPFFFQSRADEPCEVDAEDDAQRPAPRKRDKDEGDEPPHLPHQQQAPAQAEIDGDELVDEQLDGVD